MTRVVTTHYRYRASERVGLQSEISDSLPRSVTP
jgi:hypothetical protein